MEPDEEASEAVVEGIGLPRRQRERSDAGLKRCAIAEIEAGKERRVVAEERDDRETARRLALAEGSWFGGAERGASFVSMGKLAASHSGTPPLSTRT